MFPMLREIRLLAITVVAMALLTASCSGKAGSNGANGDPGTPGTPAVDRGTATGTVKDQAGAAVAAASVSTDPATLTATTDATGKFTLSSIPIGAYTVIASKAGYVDGRLAAVGIAAGGTVNLSLVLAPVASTVGSVSGTIRGRKGAGTSVPVAGAQVCVDGSTTCASSANDGTYTLSGATPGFVFVSASAPAFIAGETRQASFLAAGAAVTGVDVTLSGRPPDSASYVGSTVCMTCHVASDAAIGWKASAHSNAVDRTTGHVDVTGWPAAPADCTSPATLTTGIQAADPNIVPPPATDPIVFLVRWGASCGPGKPAFAMALDTNGNGLFDPDTDTVIPVSGSVGGVATGAGQCGQGGILPVDAPCSADLGGKGVSAAVGWWQQEYLTDIGGAAKPAWVKWDTKGTPADALVMPLAWNQRPVDPVGQPLARGEWVAAPDYKTSQDGTWSKSCAGCHESGLTLAANADGLVTTYARASTESIGCEKCHGPGSAHVAGDAGLIVNPRYLTAQSEREVCGQCHSQGVSSASPADAFGYAWNDQAKVGGGNFIPGVHKLSEFMTAPAFGDPAFYWPGGFPSVDHLTAVEFGAGVHSNNPYEKLSCGDCHSGHGGAGGPVEFARTDQKTGDKFVFQKNDAALRDDVGCLACHATQGSFAALSLADTAGYHVSAGGSIQKNGAPWVVSAADQAKAASQVASTVNAHMIAKAAMPAYFDPTGATGGPVGRCSSCHMAKTAFTGSFFSAPDRNDPTRTANIIGDVSAHTFAVAWPDASLTTVADAPGWDAVMPNACGSCHAGFRFSK